MMVSIKKRIASACLLAVAFVALPNAAHACAVCFGAADSTQTAGMNMAMVTLLGVTGTVFCGLGACFFAFRRRLLAIEHEEAHEAASEVLREAASAQPDEGLREDALAE